MHQGRGCIGNEVPFIGREALGPAERMGEFSSGGIKHVSDVLDAIGSGMHSLLHRLDFINISRHTYKSKQAESKGRL